MVGRVVAITIVLPEKALEALEKRSESEGKAVEEIIGEAVFKQLNIVDSEAKTELHLKLCEKYMREAEDFLAKKDYIQASEKAWGAAAQIVKAVAAKEGKELRSHAALWEYVDELAEKLEDVELRYLWRTANALHQNFYENWMPPREVELSVKDTKNLLEKLRKAI
ncbi:PaREP1 family protein [Candidatus Bathyarchaeota archaeon]|nr:PaREP1 family protein [Candidatus Bathyarchaeota archaeon]